MAFYTVELSTTVVVVADNSDDAFRKARSSQSSICSDTDMYIDVGAEIRSLAQLPSMWDGECIPYGGDGNSRLHDLLPTGQDRDSSEWGKR